MSYVDLRDLVTEYDDLCDRRIEHTLSLNEPNAANRPEPLDDDERDRLDVLEKLAAEFGGIEYMRGQADNDPTMIPESDWTDYCQQLADDLGYLAGCDRNPLLNYVDWEAWANDVQHDYNSVTYNDETYYCRS